MKTKLLLLAIALFAISTSNATNYLLINNPQNWGSSNGNITNAELSIKPVGLFVEYGLTLTVSAQSPDWYSSDDQLEIILNFELPNNSIITDSWLWIEGKPKRAEILDRWTASAVYEQIVNRRKDPSLLVKNGANQYAINIYPMKPKESRTFKIVYLSPAKTTGSNLNIEIPTNIIQTSSVPLKELTTYLLPNNFFSKPTSTNKNVVITDFNHPDYGQCKKTVLAKDDFIQHKITLESLSTDKIKLVQFGNNSEGYYQVSFVPSDLITSSTKVKKHCFLVDFDKNYTTQNIETFKKTLAQIIQSSLSPNDQFNVIFSNISPTPYYSSWKSGNNANVQEAFNNSELSQYSNLLSLLNKGIDFINSNGGDGKIVLISNNCSYSNISNANSILSDIEKINKNKTTVNIVDFTEGHYNYTWTNSSYYYNNQYLFSNLARRTGGEYVQFVGKSTGSNFYSLLEEGIDITNGQKLLNMDIYTSSESGFCFGRMNISNTLSKSFAFNKPIYHIGKYKDGFPTNMEIAFELDGEVMHYKANLKNYQTIKSDSVLKTVWSAFDMFDLEKQGSSNQVIGEIISQSIENRILSYYTAFLCVEDGIEICADCVDNKDNVITSADNTASNKEIKVFPSPFSSKLNVLISETDDLVELKIINALGVCVKTFVLNNKTNEYVWNGISDNGSESPEGIYLVVATYKNRVITSKAVKK